MRRAETEGRAGKQADGSARSREVKLAAIWSGDGCDKTGLPHRDAAVESIATRDTDKEYRRVLREMARRRFFAVGRRVILGDGATSTWRFADEHAPDAKQHVFDVAKVIIALRCAIQSNRFDDFRERRTA